MLSNPNSRVQYSKVTLAASSQRIAEVTDEGIMRVFPSHPLVIPVTLPARMAVSANSTRGSESRDIFDMFVPFPRGQSHATALYPHAVNDPEKPATAAIVSIAIKVNRSAIVLL